MTSTATEQDRNGLIPFTDLTIEQVEAVTHYRMLGLQEEEEAAKPEATPEPEAPKVKTWDIERFAPWDFRFNSWLLRTFGLGSRDGVYDEVGRRLWLPRRLLVWAILAHPRVRQMLWVMLSGKAIDDTASKRNGICDTCTSLKIDRRRHQRCGSCGCPDWLLSRLRVKNSRRRNHCVEKKHPGEYIKLVSYKWPNRKKPEAKPVKTGCGARHG